MDVLYVLYYINYQRVFVITWIYCIWVMSTNCKNKRNNVYLIVSNMVTSDRRVVTSKTILPGTTSGMTTKLPHDMITNSVLGK